MIEVGEVAVVEVVEVVDAEEVAVGRAAWDSEWETGRCCGPGSVARFARRRDVDCRFGSGFEVGVEMVIPACRSRFTFMTEKPGMESKSAHVNGRSCLAAIREFASS